MALEELVQEPPILPRFTGSNPSLWISQAERYFLFYAMYDDERFPYVIESFDDEPFWWFNGWYRGDVFTWNDFTTAMVTQFHDNSVDPFTIEACSIHQTQAPIAPILEPDLFVSKSDANSIIAPTYGMTHPVSIPFVATALQVFDEMRDIIATESDSEDNQAIDYTVSSIQTESIVSYYVDSTENNTIETNIWGVVAYYVDSLVMHSFSWDPGLIALVSHHPLQPQLTTTSLQSARYIYLHQLIALVTKTQPLLRLPDAGNLEPSLLSSTIDIQVSSATTILTAVCRKLCNRDTYVLVNASVGSPSGVELKHGHMGSFANFRADYDPNFGAKWLGMIFGFAAGLIFVNTPSSNQIASLFDLISTTLLTSRTSFPDPSPSLIALASLNFALPVPNLFVLDKDFDPPDLYTSLKSESIPLYFYMDAEMLEPIWILWKTYIVVFKIVLLQVANNWLSDVNLLVIANFEWKPGWQCGSVVKLREPICFIEHHCFFYKCATDVIVVEILVIRQPIFLLKSMMHRSLTHPAGWMTAANQRENKGLYVQSSRNSFPTHTSELVNFLQQVRAESTFAQQRWKKVVNALCHVVSTSPTKDPTIFAISAEKGVQPWSEMDDDFVLKAATILLFVELMWDHSNPKSLVMFHDMLRGMKTDAISVSRAVSAYANMLEIRKGIEIHAICNICDALPKKDMASRNTLIMGYAICCAIDTAISLFKSMKDVDFGRKSLAKLTVHKIEPRQMHYACMANLLRRERMGLAAAELITSYLRNADLKILGALLMVSGSLGILMVQERVKVMLNEPLKVFILLHPSDILDGNYMLMGMGIHGHDIATTFNAYGIFKWGHLNNFHKAILLCTTTLVANATLNTFFGQILAAHVYRQSTRSASFLDPDITSIAALYGHKPPNLIGFINGPTTPSVLDAHKLDRDNLLAWFKCTVTQLQYRILAPQVVTRANVVGLLKHFSTFHLEDKVNLKGGSNVMNTYPGPINSPFQEKIQAQPIMFCEERLI